MIPATPSAIDPRRKHAMQGRKGKLNELIWIRRPVPVGYRSGVDAKAKRQRLVVRRAQAAKRAATLTPGRAEPLERAEHMKVVAAFKGARLRYRLQTYAAQLSVS